MWTLSALALAGPWPEIAPPPPSGAGAGDAAVVVGVENYLLVDDVPGARDNAEDWYRWLTSTRGLSPGRVHLLRDTEATKEKIERFAGEAAAAAEPGGTVWFVFIGHGAPTPDGRDGVLVGADAQSDPDSLYARSVARSDLLEKLGTGAHAQSVVVLDTCFSGSTGRGSLMTGLQPAIPDYAFAPAPKSTVLTAGTASQFAGPLPDAGRPAFSYLVLGALTGWGDADGSGDVTASEAVAYARDTIAATVKGRSQTPELSGADLVLATGGTSRGPDVAQIVLNAGPARSGDSARVAALREARAAEQAAAARERARLEALAEATRTELEDKAQALLAEAARAWAALGAEPAAEAVLAYVSRWGDVSVSAGDQQRRVSVPEIELARARLEGGKPRRASAPAPWSNPDDSLAYLALWSPLDGTWKAALERDPSRIWDPYRMTLGFAATMGAHRAEADTYVLDAATYAEAWLTTDDPRERRAMMLSAIGTVMEARDVVRVRGHMLDADPPPFESADSEPMFSASQGDDGQGMLLTWAVLELLDRAQDADACSSLVPKLEALADEARGMGSRRIGYGDEDRLAKLWKRGKALAKKVHGCADVEAIRRRSEGELDE